MRYGTLVSAETGYSVEAFYNAYAAGEPSPVPYTNPTACPGTVQVDIGAAINQNQALPTGAPTSFATTQPDLTVPSPSVNCTFGEAETGNGAMPGLTNGYVEVMKTNISATETGSYLKSVIAKSFGIEAAMTVYLPLTIRDLVYCSPGMPGSFNPSYGPWFAPNYGNPFPMPWVEDLSGYPPNNNGVAGPWSGVYVILRPRGTISPTRSATDPRAARSTRRLTPSDVSREGTAGSPRASGEGLP